MIDLDASEDALILGLRATDPDADIEAVLEKIAKRHKVDWQSWPSWKPSAGWPPLLPWLALQYDSPGYEAMVSFAFRRAWTLEHESAKVPELFEAFARSIKDLGLVASGDGDDAGKADEQGRRALVAMFIAAGPSAVRFAYVSMRQVFAGTRTAWLDDAWRESSSRFKATAIDDAMVTTTAVSARQNTI